MGYNWVVEYCLNVIYIFYKDDDFYFNVKNLLKFLLNYEYLQLLLVGYRVEKVFVMCYQVSLYFVKKEDYFNNKYLLYLVGGVYVVSMDVVKRFVVVFFYVKYIVVDDFYFGIVVMKLNVFLQMNDSLFFFKDCKDLDFKVIVCRGYMLYKEVFLVWKMYVK